MLAALAVAVHHPDEGSIIPIRDVVGAFGVGASYALTQPPTVAVHNRFIGGEVEREVRLDVRRPAVGAPGLLAV
jgi:hypothetical protein